MADIRRPLLLTGQPLITDQRRERFWIPVQAFAADGGARPNAGALRSVSLALHILPHKGERRRRNVSARKVSEPDAESETHFSTAQLPSPRTPPQKTSSTQQAWMNSRNLTTITSAQKHRQLVFLHPTCGWSESRHITRHTIRFPLCLPDSGSSL